MIDETEGIRREMMAKLNGQTNPRTILESHWGQVWDTDELSQDFTVTGFMAPFVGAIRKSDGKKGALEFQPSPRFYYNFVEAD